MLKMYCRSSQVSGSLLGGTGAPRAVELACSKEALADVSWPLAIHFLGPKALPKTVELPLFSLLVLGGGLLLRKSRQQRAGKEVQVLSQMCISPKTMLYRIALAEGSILLIESQSQIIFVGQEERRSGAAGDPESSASSDPGNRSLRRRL